MKLPVVQGVIDRRILVNYRVDPAVLAQILPAPFRPKLVNGFGIAGICLIRLKAIRPRFVPPPFGLSSENAAHRIAVEWDEEATTREGVYIPRRDTNLRLNTVVGGRLFPGIHHLAAFNVEESGNTFSIVLESDDRQTRLAVNARLASSLPATSVFSSVSEASAFFERGSLGYSATHLPNRFDGLELRSHTWHVEPLEVTRVESSFFDNRQMFPDASVEFDCALLMRGISHEWHSRNQLCCASQENVLVQ